MGIEPAALSFHPNPFVEQRPKNVWADVLSLGGVAAKTLAFNRRADAVAQSANGQSAQKTVVSEVTTVGIRSISSYTVATESAANAAQAKAGGATVGATRSDGNVNVAAIDHSYAWNNTGWVSVDTTITFSDGSTEKSSAALSDTLKQSGDGLARKRLEGIVGGATSETAILKKLGLVSPAGDVASAAKNAPTDQTFEERIHSDISVSLTYIAQGEQRSVSGSETGTAKTIINTFAPSDLMYDGNGALSHTDASLKFSANISAGSLSAGSSASWLSGSFAESTDAITSINGPNEISIHRTSTAAAQFDTRSTGSHLESQTDSATAVTFATYQPNDRGGLTREAITYRQSQADEYVQSEVAGVTSQSAKHSGTSAVSISWTPYTPVPTVEISLTTRWGTRLS